MRIEKINDNKIKIMFNSKELEENNITVHSFLSGSLETQRLFLAILEIASEEFGFNIENSNISSETISFENKDFIVFVTKNSHAIKSQEFSKISPYNLLDFMKNYHTSKNSLSFLPPSISNESLNKLFYKLETLTEVFNFCKYFNSEITIKDIPNFLYKYNDCFFLMLDVKKLTDNEKQLVSIILSEYKNFIYLSPLAYYEFLEHSSLILTKAIQAL